MPYNLERFGPEPILGFLQALGCLLYLLVTGKLPFQAEAKLQILNGDYTLPEGGTPGVINLIRDLLQVWTRVFENNFPAPYTLHTPSCTLCPNFALRIRNTSEVNGGARVVHFRLPAPMPQFTT